jgi:hypothetical protein
MQRKENHEPYAALEMVYDSPPAGLAPLGASARIRPISMSSNRILQWRPRKLPLTVIRMSSLFQLVIQTVRLEPPQDHLPLMVSRSSDDPSPSNTCGKRMLPRAGDGDQESSTSYSPNNEPCFRRMFTMGKP